MEDTFIQIFGISLAVLLALFLTAGTIFMFSANSPQAIALADDTILSSIALENEDSITLTKKLPTTKEGENIFIVSQSGNSITIAYDEIQIKRTTPGNPIEIKQEDNTIILS